MDKNKVRTRFAPSPTGYLHVGSLRMALFEYAYAKTYKGKFILRIEDTDRKRFVEGATESLINSLNLFGINWDEGPVVGGPYEPYVQSERIKSGIYKKYADQLVSSGNAYYCFCEAKSKEKIEADHKKKKVELRDVCRNANLEEAKEKIKKGQKAAIRLRVPDEGEIKYYDFIIKKEVKWNLKDVDEAMLLKSDGFPTYHLGVVVDDVVMKINPILRGFEWMSSTPIHLLLYKYLGKDVPDIGHTSLVLDPDGGKLSKRKGNVSCEAFIEDGYLPEALLNFIMLLGWAPKDNREIFNLEDYVREFKNGNLQTGNAVFNRDKLDWFNGHYIRQKKDEELAGLLEKYLPTDAEKKLILKITPLVKERMKKLSEISELAGFFFERPEVDKKMLGENWEEHIKFALETLQKINDWNLESLNKELMDTVTSNNFHTGKFFMDLRIAITGKKQTPPINESLEILGKEETLERLGLVLGK
jgi:glutamyl-tRNA synthetase